MCGRGATTPHGSFSHDLKAGFLGRCAVVFPTDKAGDRVAFFHACALINPVVWLRASPVAATIKRYNAAGADDVALVRATPSPFLCEDADCVVDFLFGEPTENAVTCNDSFVRTEGADGKDGVATEPHHVCALVDSFLGSMILTYVPVLVMPYTKKGFAASDLIGVEAIAVGTIRNIVPVLLHPIGQREFPQQKLARSVGEGVFKDLGVFCVVIILLNKT